MTVGETQMPARVSSGDRDAVLRQIRWCAAVQTLVNCHCELEENLVGNVKPMQFVVQYLTKTAIKLPSAGDKLITRAAAFNLSVTVLGAPARTVLQ